MQEIITSFSSIMTWLVLLLCLVVVVLLGLAAWHLPSNRRRALLGVVLMAPVALAMGAGWLLLSQKAQSWSRLLLPLAAPLLLLSLYRLSFPPLVPGSHRQTRHQVLLLPASDGCSPVDQWVGAARSALPVKRACDFLSSAPGGRTLGAPHLRLPLSLQVLLVVSGARCDSHEQTTCRSHVNAARSGAPGSLVGRSRRS